MAEDQPQLYFRVRENGAAVFCLDSTNRNQSLDLQQIAVVNINRGDFKPHGDHVLSAAETEVISAWVTRRRVMRAAREWDDVQRGIDQISQIAHWAQARASDAQLAEITDDLIFAMHDLRNVLLRKRADRIARRAEDD